jgi:tripartite-type tricarboxylate transporter receptor subunit TctC
MAISRRHVLHVSAAAAALAAGGRIALAQAYPTRPITMIVPFPAGGATDTLARLLSEPLRASLGQPVIIENVAGAAGSIGVGRAARAAPDGYTLSIGTLTTHALIGGLYPLQFDLVTDFEPIAVLASEPLLIVGRKNLPAADLKELIAWLKANPDTASVGIAGVGAVGHLTGISFQRETGTRFHFVPYRGNGPAAQDLVAGQIDLMIEPSSNFRALVRAGSIKAFAVTSATRAATASEIPTAEEAGLPGFRTSLWYGLWASKGTPQPVIGRLNDAVVEALADPAVQKRLIELGLEIAPRDQQTPKALATLQRADIAKWWPIIKAANIRGE